MKDLLKKNYYLILVFFFFLGWNLIISPLNLDEIWNYGFTRNILIGEIPYKDFNMVITPFYPFIMSILMHIFGNNMLFFHIENALILTIFFYFMNQFLGKNSWIVLSLMIWPMNVSYPSYNLFSLFLAVIIIYLEEKENKEEMIGLLTGLLFITKQSIGIPFFIVSLLIEKDKKKILKRLLLFLVPVMILLLVLMLTHSLYPFINLCILGLFDFQKTNGNIFNIVFFLTLIFVLLTILFLRKEKQKKYLYLLAFSVMTIPIFDYYHFVLFFILFIIVFLSKYKGKEQFVGLEKIVFGFILLASFTSFHFNSSIYPNKIPHFEYRYMEESYIENTNQVNKLLQKYDNKVIIIGPDSYYHKIIWNEKIGYLDLVNTGNWGYHGSERLLSKIKEVEKDYVFFINKQEKWKQKQTDQKAIDWIEENGVLLEQTRFYDIYQIKE